MRVYSFGPEDAFPKKSGAPAFLVQEGNELMLVDCPPGINLLLHEIGLTPLDLTAVFITHLHNDHVGGLIELIQYRTLCLNKPELFKPAGYFTNVAIEKLPVMFLGVINYGVEKEWYQSVMKLIDFNTPKGWQLFHDVKIWSEGIHEFRGRKISTRFGHHEPASSGIKFDDLVAISGDTKYNKDFVEWLTLDVKMVFHEAGFGQGHTHLSALSSIFSSHKNLYFYHIPFPLISDIALQYRIVERRWYEV